MVSVRKPPRPKVKAPPPPEPSVRATDPSPAPEPEAPPEDVKDLAAAPADTGEIVVPGAPDLEGLDAGEITAEAAAPETRDVVVPAAPAVPDMDEADAAAPADANVVVPAAPAVPEASPEPSVAEAAPTEIPPAPEVEAPASLEAAAAPTASAPVTDAIAPTVEGTDPANPLPESEGAATSVTIEAPPDRDLPQESTDPGAAEGTDPEREVTELESASTQVSIEVPPTRDTVEIPAEAAMAGAPMPAPPPEPEDVLATPITTSAPLGDLIVEPTVVVAEDAVAGAPAATYSMDMDSGAVELQPETGGRRNLPTYVVEGTPAKSGLSGGVIFLVVVAVVVGLGGIGFLGWVLLNRPTGDGVIAVQPLPETGQSNETPPPEVTPEPSDPPPAPEGEGTEPTPAPSEPGTEPAADGEEPVAEAPVEPTGTVESLQGFELELPRVSRRARRLPDAQRRRFNLRLKNQALRAYRAEDYPEAERLYRDAMTYNDWDVASLEGLARTTAQQDRFAEAIAWAELAVSRNPRSAAAYRVLGDVWRQAGHTSEASAAYRRGLSRHPDDRWLRQRLRDVSE